MNTLHDVIDETTHKQTVNYKCNWRDYLPGEG